MILQNIIILVVIVVLMKGSSNSLIRALKHLSMKISFVHFSICQCMLNCLTNGCSVQLWSCIWMVCLCIHCSESEKSAKLGSRTPNISTLNDFTNLDTKPSMEKFLPVTPPATPPATPPPAESPSVRVDGISASWSYERETLVLSSISLEVNKVSLCDVIVYCDIQQKSCFYGYILYQ